MASMSRRSWLRGAAAAAVGSSIHDWLLVLAAEAAVRPTQRHCVLLWMAGGPSQLDTFDLKPGHAHGGEFREIATAVPGLRFSEHLPRLSQQADRLAIVRGLSTKEGDHGRGTYTMRTGRPPRGPEKYPAIGAAIAKELGASAQQALHFVSISPYLGFNPEAFGPGFLGPRCAPLTVDAAGSVRPVADSSAGFADLRVDDLRPPGSLAPDRTRTRLQLWRSMQDEFLASHAGASPAAHDTVYRQALQLMDSSLTAAFNLAEEPDAVRTAYGRGRFGQGCLLARRLIERGVSFVEVTLGGFDNGGVGWDTHVNNFAAVRSLSAELDAGWAMLMSELADRGLLEATTILWMGEFGRTPAINDNAGRDHFPAAWTCVFAGGGIRGGQAHGQTSPDGREVVAGKVNEADVLATLCRAVGLDPQHENFSAQGRPVKLSEGSPLAEILA